METDQAELLVTIASFLEHHNIPYMITGAWSVIYYGRPRASHDIDFVVEMYKRDTKRILTALHHIPHDFMIDIESAKNAVALKGMFQVFHKETLLKLDFWILTDEGFDQSRFTRRQRVTVLDQPMYFASPEDTIIQKLRWYQMAKIEKHIVDAAFVYQIQKKNLDVKYLTTWIKKLRLLRYFNQVQKIDLAQYL
ncbi:nucleotidyl transferase AbiEii/AbiGii toxin family protein [Candidatus Gottesmanbacteria bacterium]|nr:nucleotidyl transferase AbiEii/AbiGii toxin family protein [Candidatus Gottesmanbacteria bacterium]